MSDRIPQGQPLSSVIDFLHKEGFDVVKRFSPPEPPEQSSTPVESQALSVRKKGNFPKFKEVYRHLVLEPKLEKKLMKMEAKRKKKDGGRIPVFGPTYFKGTEVQSLRYVGIQSTAISSDGSGIVNGVLNLDLSTSFTYNDNGLLDDFWDEYRFVKTTVHMPLTISYQGTTNATTSPILVAVIDYQNSGAYTSLPAALVQNNKVIIKANDQGIKQLHCQYDGDTNFVWVSTGSLNDPPGYLKFYGRGWPVSSTIFSDIWIEHVLQCRQRN